MHSMHRNERIECIYAFVPAILSPTRSASPSPRGQLGACRAPRRRHHWRHGRVKLAIRASSGGCDGASDRMSKSPRRLFGLKKGYAGSRVERRKASKPEVVQEVVASPIGVHSDHTNCSRSAALGQRRAQYLTR